MISGRVSSELAFSSFDGKPASNLAENGESSSPVEGIVDILPRFSSKGSRVPDLGVRSATLTVSVALRAPKSGTRNTNTYSTGHSSRREVRRE